MMVEHRIPRPRYGVQSLKAALARSWRGWHLSEKMDGAWALRELSGSVVTGEAMPDGRFMAFDVLMAFGQDVRNLPWTDRCGALADLFARIPAGLNWRRCPAGAGAEFIEAVIARGGEGVVAKPWDAPFGVCWVKVKRSETFDCIVVEKNHARGSVRLDLDGADVGWCPARALFDKIRLGDVLEVAAFGRHPSGRLREARAIRIRNDKSEINVAALNP